MCLVAFFLLLNVLYCPGNVHGSSIYAGETIPVINEAVAVLKGHKSRITDMCWSIFEPHKLLTVSYDSKALVGVSMHCLLQLFQSQRHIFKLLTSSI